MDYQIALLFITFIIYSFFGYLIEVTSMTLDNKKLVLSRGFLIGPIIPVFGFGALAIILFLTRYSDEIITLFIMSTVICMVIEYFTSFLMEKIFNLRWWDYSYKKYNINGRVTLDFCLYFGIGGVIMLKFIHPLISKLLLSIDPKVIVIIGTILLILFIIDFVVSTDIIFRFKKNVHKLVKKDSTFRIKKEVRRVLKERSLLTIRLIKAFPYVNRNNKDHEITKLHKLVLDKKDYKNIQEKRKGRK